MDLTTTLQADLVRDRPRADWGSGRLAGARCSSCGSSSWPARSVCYRCGSPDVADVRFSPTGSLLTYTSVWVPRPGLQTPYTLGQVHLDDGPVVFGHVRDLPDGATVPCPVRLFLADDAGATPWYWFEPAAGQAASREDLQGPDQPERPSHG